MYATSEVFGAVVAMNLLVLSSFVAPGISTFWFVRWLTGPGSCAAAIAAGAAAFQAAEVFNAATAPDFAHLWVLPLLAWRMFVLRDRPSRVNGLWAGAAGSPSAVAWNPETLTLSMGVASSLYASRSPTSWTPGEEMPCDPRCPACCGPSRPSCIAAAAIDAFGNPCTGVVPSRRQGPSGDGAVPVLIATGRILRPSE